MVEIDAQGEGPRGWKLVVRAVRARCRRAKKGNKFKGGKQKN